MHVLTQVGEQLFAERRHAAFALAERRAEWQVREAGRLLKVEEGRVRIIAWHQLVGIVGPLSSKSQADSSPLPRACTMSSTHPSLFSLATRLFTSLWLQVREAERLLQLRQQVLAVRRRVVEQITRMHTDDQSSGPSKGHLFGEALDAALAGAAKDAELDELAVERAKVARVNSYTQSRTQHWLLGGSPTLYGRSASSLPSSPTWRSPVSSAERASSHTPSKADGEVGGSGRPSSAGGGDASGDQWRWRPSGDDGEVGGSGRPSSAGGGVQPANARAKAEALEELRAKQEAHRAARVREKAREAARKMAEEAAAEAAAKVAVGTGGDKEAMGDGHSAEVAADEGQRRAQLELASLRHALAGSLTHVRDAFHTWDTDGDGLVDRTEFRSAVSALGLEISLSVCDSAFDAYDTDCSGRIDHGEYVRHTLREAVSLSHSRAVDLFRRWDDEDAGVIDEATFRKGVVAMGFEAPRETTNALFGEMDHAGAGRINYTALRSLLYRRGTEGASPQPSPSSAAAHGKSGHSSISRGGTATDEASKKAPITQAGESPSKPKLIQSRIPAEREQLELASLRHALAGSLTHVRDAFHTWDTDGDGLVDRTEFRSAVSALGLEISLSVCDSAFDAYDTDCSGRIDHGEYVRHTLREAVSLSHSRAVDLFRRWDDEDAGVIDEATFRKGVVAMGFEAPRETTNALFGEMDHAGAGRINYTALCSLLRQHQTKLISAKTTARGQTKEKSSPMAKAIVGADVQADQLVTDLASDDREVQPFNLDKSFMLDNSVNSS